jgi:hypothetical protein
MLSKWYFSELNSAVAKGTVKHIWQYFSTLVKKYQTGEFVPTSDLAERRTGAKDKKAAKLAIDICPYCDERGLLEFQFADEQGVMRVMPVPFCDHNADRIKAFALKKSAEITSAQSDYRIINN